jgi:hypothetical protein
LSVVVPLVIGIGIDVAIEGKPAVGDLVGAVTNPAMMSAIVAGVVVSIVGARLKRVMLRHSRHPCKPVAAVRAVLPSPVVRLVRDVQLLRNLSHRPALGQLDLGLP